MFNEFLYQNKFVTEKHIKFIIETDTHIKLYAGKIESFFLSKNLFLVQNT
jgi:hypothetical protein